MEKTSKPLVKICGLSDMESVDVAVRHGASHIGFIFFPASPRDVDAETARDLASRKGEAKSVAVTVNADDAMLDAIVSTMQPDMLQLHGYEPPQRVRDVKQRYDLPVIKAVPVSTADDLVVLGLYDSVADLLLLDAKPPKDATLPGGNGVRFNWSVLDGLQTTTPALLSGGISATNLDDALGMLDRVPGLSGLDLSSGVESAPGVKDVEKIATLLDTCMARASA